MARDVTKTLSDTEVAKLRALLSQNPEIIEDESLGGEYPKMLFHPKYVTNMLTYKTAEDPIVKKAAKEQMRRLVLVVEDIETEEEYLGDGWRTSPAEIMIRDLGLDDPRIPKGREARRQQAINRVDRETELRQLRRRYAELTGHPFSDVVPDAPAVAQELSGDDPVVETADATDGPEVPDLREGAARRVGGRLAAKAPAAKKSKLPITKRERVAQRAAAAAGR